MGNYSVKQLADLAGVSVRTLHVYDSAGLLKPAVRTAAGYRLYGRAELLRLQQILFYRQLGLPLQQIMDILDAEDFDLIKALQYHRAALLARAGQIEAMIATIDKTILHLKNDTMLTDNELYDGLPREEAETRKKQATELYGADAVNASEAYLRKLSKEEIDALKEENNELMQHLHSLLHLPPESTQIQALIAKHYNIIRRFWGTAGTADPQLRAYKGLGELYVNDERFILTGDKYDREFAVFMRDAMNSFEL